MRLFDVQGSTFEVRRLVSLVFALLVWLPATGGLSADKSGEDLFTQANRAFAAGHYADAIRDYEIIVSKQGFSAPLLFNLANAYFRDGKIGNAILNYERALALAPNDADIEANLRFARKASSLFAPDITWWQRAAHLFSMNGWAWLASGSLTLLCGCGMARMLFNLRTPGNIGRNLWRAGAVLFAITLFAAMVCLGILMSDFDQAVILAPETPVRLGPFDTATSSSTLPSGEMVVIQGRHENFVLIRSRDGRTGWVASPQVEHVLKN